MKNKLKTSLVVLSMVIITLSMFAFSTKSEARLIETKAHSHKYYGPYRISYAGLTMKPGYPSHSYSCGEKKPCRYSSYEG